MSEWLYDCPIEKISNSIIGGGTPARNISSYWNGDIPWASVKDFTDEKILLQNIQEKISIQGLKNSAANLIKPNFPIICFRMAVGRVGYSNEPIAINQDLKAIDLKEDIHHLFFIYLISSLRSNLESIAIGSTVKGITLKQFLKYKINIPSDYNEQKKIANILISVDKVIEATERTIKKYKAIKQGMLEDFFTHGVDSNGKVRPCSSQAPELYKPSELGLIPKDWDVKRLESLCIDKPTYGINAAAVEFVHNLPTYLRITDIIEDGKFSHTNKKCVDNILANNYILQEGDLVFARTGASVGKTYLYNKEDGLLVFAGFLIKVSPNNKKLDSRYLKFYTETSFYWNWVEIMSQRSGQPGINGSEYGSLKIPVPHPTEQAVIADKLSAINSKLNSEFAYLNKIKSTKKGLMSDLLSGKKPVKI